MQAAAMTFANDQIQPSHRPEMAIKTNFRLPVATDFVPGTILGLVSSASVVNEVKTITITGSPTGGSFYIGISGQPMLTAAYNISLANLDTLLETVLGSGTVVVTGTPGSSYVITFGGQLAGVRVGTFTVGNSFTGGTSPAIAIVNTTPGSCGAGQADAYASGNSDGTQIAKAILETRVKANATGGNDNWVVGSDAVKSYPAFIAGHFFGADLTGLDANCLTLAGWRTVKGVISNAGHVVGLGF